MQLIPLTTEGANLLRDMKLKKIGELMRALTPAQADALRKLVTGDGIHSTGESTLNVLVRHGVLECCERAKCSRTEVITARHTGYALTSLGYQLAFDFGFMNDYNAYARELDFLVRQA